MSEHKDLCTECSESESFNPYPAPPRHTRRTFTKAVAGGVMGLAAVLGYRAWEEGATRPLTDDEFNHWLDTTPLDGLLPEHRDAIDRRDPSLREQMQIREPSKIAALAGYCFYIQGCISTQACPQYRNWHQCRCCAPAHPCTYGQIVYGKCCASCTCYQYAGQPCTI